MRFFRKNKVSTVIENIRKDKNEPVRTITEHKKVCTIPVYLWKDEVKNINEETIMKNLLDYDYYNYALEEKYKSVEDCKKWVSDGDTMMHFRIYEVKAEITYEIETVEYPYGDTRKYKEITSIKYLGLCRRVPFESLGMEKVFTGESGNLLFTSLSDVDKLHKIKFADYCRDKYFSMTKKSGLESDFIKEIYERRIKSTFGNCHSYATFRNTNNAIYYINKVIEENKGSSREMLAYKIAKELNLA